MKRLLVSMVSLGLVLASCYSQESDSPSAISTREGEATREEMETTSRAVAGDGLDALLSGGKGGEGAMATCTASCAPAASVSCSGSSCSSQDRDCAAGQRGYVECNGVRTECAPCGGGPPPVCIDGHYRYPMTNDCCCTYDNPSAPVPGLTMREELCVDGQWVHINNVCLPGVCEGLCPLLPDP